MRVNTVTIVPGDVVLDYAFWRPTAQEIKDRNIKCVVRYISYGTSKKRITLDEILFLHSQGVAILIIFEWSATRANQGRQAGLDDGAFSHNNLHELDYPVDAELAALFAIDTNTIAGNIQAHAAYSEGFDEGLGDYTASGIYGDNDIISYCILNNITILNWWAGASAWSNGKPPVEGCHVRQTISGSTPNFDNNRVLKPFKAWLPHEESDVIEPMKPYVFKLASGDTGIRNESGSRAANLGELEPNGPLFGEVVYDIPAGSNWEFWITKELKKYERELDPQEVTLTVPPGTIPTKFSGNFS